MELAAVTTLALNLYRLSKISASAYRAYTEKKIEFDSFTRGWQAKLIKKYRQQKSYPRKSRKTGDELNPNKRGRLLLEQQNPDPPLIVPAAKAAKTTKPRKPKTPSATKSAQPKKKKNFEGTPLQRFKKQTLAKRTELIKARKAIDKDLRAIERDLGVLKRK